MELATLGIKIESQSVEEASASLDKFVERSKRSEEATQKMVDKLTMKSATLKLTTRETELFKLAIGNATDAQLKEADAALKAIEAHEKLNKELKEAEDRHDKFAKGLKAAFSVVATAIGSAITAAAGYLVVLDKMIGKVADYQDIAEKAGTSAVGIAKLRTSADVAGTSMEQVGSNLAMMQRQLSRTNDESIGAAKGLSAIGLSIDDVRKMKPEEAYIAIAKALEGVEESSGKQAIMQDVLGRGAAAQAVHLKELAKQKEIDSMLTQEQIDLADTYKDKLAESKSRLMQQAEALAIATIPTQYAFRQALMETITQLTGLGEKSSDLAKNNAVNEWASAAALAIASVIDYGVKAFNVLRGIGEGLGSLAAAAAAVLRADLTDQKSLQAAGNAVRDIWAEHNKRVADMMTGPSFRANLEKQLQLIKDNGGKIAVEEENIRKKVDRSGYTSREKKEKTDPGIKQAENEYLSLMETIKKRITLGEEELSGGRKLTEAEKWYIDILAKVNSERSKLNPVQRAAILAEIEEANAVNMKVEAKRRETKAYIDAYQQRLKDDDDIARARTEQAKERERIAVGLSEYGQATKDAARANDIEAESIGGTDDARKIALITLQAEIDLRKEENKIRKATYDSEDERQAVLDQAKLASAKDTAEKIRRVQIDASKASFAQADSVAHKFFTDMFEDGTNAFRNLGKSIKTYLIDVLYELTVKKWVVNIVTELTGGGGMMGALTGGQGAIGGVLNNLIGGGGNIMNLFSNFGGSVSNGVFNAGYGLMNNGFESLGGTLMENANMIGDATSFLGNAMGYIGAVGQAAQGKWGSAIGTGIGTYFGGPIGAMIGGALGGMVDSWFGGGGGPKSEGSAGYNAGGIIGAYGNELDANAAKAVDGLNAAYKRLAGLFGGDTSTTFGVGLSTDPQGDAPSMVYVGNSRGGYSSNTGVGRSQEELAKALASMSSDVLLDAVLSSGIDGEILGYFNKITAGLDAEGKLAALEQVAQMVQIRNALRDMGNVVASLSNISLEATGNLIAFSGGIQNLQAGMAAYQQNFFNEYEQREMALKNMANIMNQPGSGWVGATPDILSTWSKDFFRQIVDGLDLSTEMGQRQFATMMKLAPIYAQYINAMEQSGMAARTAADAERAKYEAAVQQERQSRKANLDKAISDVTAAYNKQKSALESLRDTLISATWSFYDTINGLRTDSTLSTLTPGERLKQSQDYYRTSLGDAYKSGFSGDSVSRLTSAARDMLGQARDVFASGAEYQKLFDQVNTELTNAQAQATKDASTAQKQLDTLERQAGYLATISERTLTMDQALQAMWNAQYQYNQTFAPGFQPPSHALGLDRVPYDGYVAKLHRDETVLTAPQANFFRAAPNLVSELVALRSEVARLRTENRQDAGNSIGATYDATRQSAERMAEATVRAAMQRTYQSRKRQVLA